MSSPADLVREGMVAASNAASAPLEVWIEPWCDDLLLPPRSTIAFEPLPIDEGGTLAPMLEIDDGRLVVWASGQGTMNVLIDDVLQDTGSAMIPLPSDMFGMAVKSFVGLVFGDQPAARPGGRPAPLGTRRVRSRFRRLRDWLAGN